MAVTFLVAAFALSLPWQMFRLPTAGFGPLQQLGWASVSAFFIFCIALVQTLLLWGVLWVGHDITRGERPGFSRLFAPLRAFWFVGSIAARLLARLMLWVVVGLFGGFAVIVTVASLAYGSSSASGSFTSLFDIFTRAVAPAVLGLAGFALTLVLPPVLVWYNHGFLPYIAMDQDLESAGAAPRRARAIPRAHKWELFWLDLSFLGWLLLTVLSFGLAAPFVTAYWAAARGVHWRHIELASTAA